ncbi:MAG: hypothetical protein PHN64_02935 [Desulfovibrionaceae bacterium]|jgi:drug/metabolite transporter (DMT)-like permease|nr:hypothetical protein [Desulfovibrionaceae bacterium]
MIRLLASPNAAMGIALVLLCYFCWLSLGVLQATGPKDAIINAVGSFVVFYLGTITLAAFAYMPYTWWAKNQKYGFSLFLNSVTLLAVAALQVASYLGHTSLF